MFHSPLLHRLSRYSFLKIGCRIFVYSTPDYQYYTISENLYRVSGFDEISNACNPGYGGAVDDAFFESGNMS